MRLLLTILALIVSYVAASLVLSLVAGDTLSAPRFVVSVLIAALVAAAVYTLVKDGPRALTGIFRRR